MGLLDDQDSNLRWNPVRGNRAKAIFEVKTSLNLSDQVYKGIGQLLCYHAEYGLPDSKLFLVLPHASRNNTQLDLLRTVFERIGITPVFWNRGKFADENNRELSLLLSL
jgi:hypothetical protein